MKAVVPIDVKDLKVVEYTKGENKGVLKICNISEDNDDIKTIFKSDKQYDLSLDFNIMIVDTRETNKGIEIIYDLYLNNKRIQTDLKIKRRYDDFRELALFTKRIKELVLKKLL